MWLATEMAQGHRTVRPRNLGFLSKDIQTCLRLMAELLSKFRAKSQTVVGICYHPPVDIHSPNCSFIRALNCLWGTTQPAAAFDEMFNWISLPETPELYRCQCIPRLAPKIGSSAGSSIPQANSYSPNKFL